MNKRFIATITLTLALGTSVWGVRPGTWKHATEADWNKTERKNTIVTNLGDVRLARAAEKLADLEGDDSIVYDLVQSGDKRTFAAVGPQGKLVAFDGKKVKTVAEYKGAQIFSLASTKEGLWVAVSGAKSFLELRTGRDMKVSKKIELPKVRYVWQILSVGNKLYLATGTKGRVLVVEPANPKKKPVVALETKQDNVLCLGADARGRVYAGTDSQGLIIRISPTATGYKSFVVYDAPEPEIGALLVLKDGTVYAGTADANHARPGRMTAASTRSSGRPVKTKDTAKEPKVPNVPPKPQPKPGTTKPKTPAVKPPAEPKPVETKPALTKPVTPKPEPKKPPAKPPAKPAASKTPTKEQYDALRAAIAKKLAEAKESGSVTLQASPRPSMSRPSLPTRTSSTSRRSSAGGRKKSGNAIYRISSDGFVHEVFRESVMILRMARQGNALVVATGNEGQVYRVNPDTEEVTTIANLSPKQVPALLDLGRGNVLVGTANPGRLMRLSDTFEKEGVVTSQTLDASQISLWGKLQVSAFTSGGTSVQVQTRSGNVADSESGSWSDWSKPQTVRLRDGLSDYLDVLAPTARFLQYRITLKSSGKASPTLSAVSLKYLMPNLKPKITSIKATPSFGRVSSSSSRSTAPRPYIALKIDWSATDANRDSLSHKLEYRRHGSNDPFVTIVKNLSTSTYTWDTRTTPDGRYEVRLTTDDSKNNVPDQVLKSSRVSDPVVVDNTPPSVSGFGLKSEGKGQATLTAKVTDRLSPIIDVRYKADSETTWRYALPLDLIYDSTSESIRVKITDLSAGSHVITVRAVDAQGNSQYVSGRVTVK